MTLSPAPRALGLGALGAGTGPCLKTAAGRSPNFSHVTANRKPQTANRTLRCWHRQRLHLAAAAAFKSDGKRPSQFCCSSIWSSSSLQVRSCGVYLNMLHAEQFALLRVSHFPFVYLHYALLLRAARPCVRWGWLEIIKNVFRNTLHREAHSQLGRGWVFCCPRCAAFAV